MIFLVVLFFRHRIAAMLGNPDVAPWLFFLPVSLFFVANYQALRYWVMRLQNFSTVSQGMVVKVSSNYLSAIMIKLGAVPLPAGGGLVMGAILADIANAAWLFFGCRKRDRVLFEKMRPRRLAGMARRHGSMAATLTVSHGVGVLNMRIPGLVISSFFGPAALGFFGVAERLASAPSQLVSGAIGDVYRQRASVLYRETGRFDRLMVKTLLMTFVLAIVPYAIGIAFAPDIFRILLGPQWEEAGRYASIIMVGGFFSFVTTPVDKAAIITGGEGDYPVRPFYAAVPVGAFIGTGMVFGSGFARVHHAGRWRKYNILWGCYNKTSATGKREGQKMIQDAPVDLGLRFKGERTYLHGSDIYEAVSRAVRQQPDEKAWVSSLALRRTARTGCRLLYGEYEGDSDNIIATFRVLGSGQCSMGTVIETGRKVGGRYDYNEGQVVRGSEITDNMVAR